MRINHILLFIFTFNFIFGPRLIALDIMLAISVIASFLGGVYFLLIKRKILMDINKVILILVIPLVYVLIISASNNFQDLTGIQLIFKGFLYLVGSYFIVELYKKMYRSEFSYKLIKDIFWIGFVNSFITVLIYVNPSIRTFFISVLDYTTTQEAWAREGRRVFDISMGGGAGASVVFAIILLLGIEIVIRENRKIIYFIAFSIISLSVFVTGRTGLIILLFAPLYYLFVKNKSKKYNFKLRKMKIPQLYFIFALIILTFIIFNVSSVSIFQTRTVSWALEFFGNSNNTLFTTSSTNEIISNMYFIPDSFLHFIFGDSNFGRTSHLLYIASDVGYIRTLFAFGLIGVLFIYLIYIYVVFIGWRFFWKDITARLLVTYTIIILVVNLKELNYMPRGGGAIFFLLLVSFYYSRVNIIREETH